MFNLILRIWPLFFGYAIICLGHGLQGTLIGVRAVIENFSFIETGIIITGYYVGYLSGSISIPIFLKKVGHIRVFAALASLASIAILLHTVFILPYLWFFIRILTGISIAGIFVIMESWLNEKADNRTRGGILSIYMIITFTFLGLGNFLLNLSDPAQVDLFILVSVLLSFSLIPILLTSSNQPNFKNTKRLTFIELYNLSPLGFVGSLMIGLSHSALFGLGAVYAKSRGLDNFQVSIFLVIVTVFGSIFQWPIGYVSDRIDRRIILIITTLIAAGICILIIGSSFISITLLFILLALYAGMSLPTYSLTIAHTNDYLQPEQIVAASASIAVLVGLGSVFGPIIASYFMTIFGSNGFFVYLFFIHLFLGLFGIYRMSIRTKPSDIESQYVPLPRTITPTGMELNPKAEIEEDYLGKESFFDK
ncbi:MAG: putative MFS-type transporter YcaD [Alphaproteobacteria bacterium MarineAlpha5_Bin11]|nr:MFS transporter [Pelagibacteraceae bacterium]PPR44579.1 MAG: putative MFS-type transporter YcaD [Alphaproteobacteria bacterium MarineAlpha5_Bin11]PPR50875.1 MAG: putative MFS-type transporter YcaD [Alphaproteobacteria bacterium MarineAlpha5_Bin10]|tara:strand:- start:9205 stop:10470 length:1266 start_codon:yes stop_codon:yes gene_type:complete